MREETIFRESVTNQYDKAAYLITDYSNWLGIFNKLAEKYFQDYETKNHDTSSTISSSIIWEICHPAERFCFNIDVSTMTWTRLDDLKNDWTEYLVRIYFLQTTFFNDTDLISDACRNKVLFN